MVMSPVSSAISVMSVIACFPNERFSNNEPFEILYKSAEAITSLWDVEKGEDFVGAVP